MTAQQAVGSAIRFIRKKRGLTITKLAGVAGISQPALSNIEHGKVDVRLLSMVAICQALRVHPRVVMNRAFK